MLKDIVVVAVVKRNWIVLGIALISDDFLILKTENVTYTQSDVKLVDY